MQTLKCLRLMKRKRIDPNTYLRSGWDNPAPVRYRRGNLENRISMTLLWIYLVTFAVILTRSFILFLND